MMTNRYHKQRAVRDVSLLNGASGLRPASHESRSVTHAKSVVEPIGGAQGLGRRGRHREDIFERLVDAAREIVFHSQLDDATIQNITDKADVGKGTFFNYFTSKDHVVPEFVEQANRLLISAVERLRSTDVSAVEVFTDFLTRHWLRDRSDSEWMTFYSSILLSMAHNDEVRIETSLRIVAIRSTYAELVALGQQRGEFRTDIPARDLGRYIYDMITGIALAAWIDGLTPRLSAEDPRFRLMLETLIGPKSTVGQRSKKRKRALRHSVPVAQSRAARRPRAH